MLRCADTGGACLRKRAGGEQDFCGVYCMVVVGSGSSRTEDSRSLAATGE